MGYVGICDEFGKGSLLIYILCYVRSVVFVCHCRFCVVHFYLTHFVFFFVTNLLRTPVLLAWWWGMFPCTPRVLTAHVRAILNQCLNDSDISILRTQIVRSTERMYRKWALFRTLKFTDK